MPRRDALLWRHGAHRARILLSARRRPEHEVEEARQRLALRLVGWERAAGLVGKLPEQQAGRLIARALLRLVPAELGEDVRKEVGHASGGYEPLGGAVGLGWRVLEPIGCLNGRGGVEHAKVLAHGHPAAQMLLYPNGRSAPCPALLARKAHTVRARRVLDDARRRDHPLEAPEREPHAKVLLGDAHAFPKGAKALLVVVREEGVAYSRGGLPKRVHLGSNERLEDRHVERLERFEHLGRAVSQEEARHPELVVAGRRVAHLEDHLHKELGRE